MKFYKTISLVLILPFFGFAQEVEQDSLSLGNELFLDDVVITGTMKPVTKLDSPVPVEVYSETFFKANPSPSVFDAMQNINGVRPQVNCNVCNTGDIHINGLEGSYTMVLIDGMPIVSGLSSVYGLSGIPQALIDRVEVVKGPASTLYGSEAVGGLINVLTKNPLTSPNLAVDANVTSWQEVNVDIGKKFDFGENVSNLLGVNYYNYSNPIDNNHDNFTDLTLQHRISIFNKINVQRDNHKEFSLAGRYVYEDRWGGDMNWNSSYRGGSELYGESIWTSRWEMFGVYELPWVDNLKFQFSANGHDQNSVYGDTKFIADQKIGFGQLTWGKTLNAHDLLLGAAYRYTYFDDNTPVTFHQGRNAPSKTHLPGVFIQDQISLGEQNTILAGLRYDYNSLHGSILTPRLNYKWNSLSKNSVLRMSLGNGYRVANVFTEDHAALTGSRDVVFLEDLKPEKSWNANLNFVQSFYMNSGHHLSLDATAFYTYFNNKIIADYDTDYTKVIYQNLDGHAVSKGVSLNVNWVAPYGLRLLAGATLMDVYSVDGEDVKTRELFSERFTGTWSASYKIRDWGLTLDYTGNFYSPIRLPLLNENDPRSEFSPWWSIQNIQLTKKMRNGIEIYGGVKNLLNWTPSKNEDFVIARTHDPFDDQVQFDGQGNPMITPENPYGLVFDPAYVYASLQGIRGFLGIRFTLR